MDMNTRQGTTTTTTTHYIEVAIDAAFEPSGDAEWLTGVVLPKWIEDRHEAVRLITRDEMLTLDYHEDTVTVSRCKIQSGVASAELKFNAPEEYMHELDARALLAVVEAWSR